MSEPLSINEYLVEVTQAQASHLVSSAQMRHEPPVCAVEEQITREARKQALERDLTLVGAPFVVWKAEVVWKAVKQPEDMDDETWDAVIDRYEEVIVEAIDRS